MPACRGPTRTVVVEASWRYAASRRIPWRPRRPSCLIVSSVTRGGRGYLPGRGPAAAEQRQAAQPDAGHDGHAAAGLLEADRVPERHRARGGADQRLEVEE